jgi:beta-galactosidase
VEDLFAKGLLDDDTVNGALSLDMRLRLPEGEDVAVRAELTDADGAAYSFEFPAKPQTQVRFPVPAPRRWSAEAPNLYRLRLALEGRSGVFEVAETMVGFRRFEMKDKLMLLNGKRVEFRGVNRHEFSAVGAAR